MARQAGVVDRAQPSRSPLDRAQEREAAIKKETAALKQLIEANTVLTQEDKTLTETIETLTRETHARLPSA